MCGLFSGATLYLCIWQCCHRDPQGHLQNLTALYLAQLWHLCLMSRSFNWKCLHELGSTDLQLGHSKNEVSGLLGRLLTMAGIPIPESESQLGVKMGIVESQPTLPITLSSLGAILVEWLIKSSVCLLDRARPSLTRLLAIHICSSLVT